jgi:tetratricopeptide (TPR) repeat protein
MTTLRPSRAPSTRGLLSASSLGELLAFALEQRLHGSLVFETPTGRKSALFLAAGCVTKARTADPVPPLGQLLVDERLIEPATLDAGLARAGLTGNRLGEVLVELAAVTEEQVEAALGEQLGRRVSLLGRLPGSSGYGFYVDRDFLGGSAVCDADPLALIWRAVRDAELTPRQKQEMVALSGRKLRLHPASAPERLGLTQQEQIVVNALRTRPRALDELLRAALLDGEKLQRLMYALVLTQQIEQGPGARPLDVGSNLSRSSRAPLGSYASLPLPGTRRSIAPARPSLQPSADRRFSLPPPTPARSSRLPSAMRSSLPPGARDSLAPRPSLPTRPEAMPRSSSMPDSQPPRAHSSLRPAGAERRTESTGSLHPNDPVQLASARASFEAAREHVQRQQFEAAEKLARRAKETDPGNAEYLALHAWLRAQLGELRNPEQSSQIVAALDRAVLKERESVSIRYYRGQVLNRLGREEEAVRDFEFVLRHEPGHVDAARELRLHDMRKRGAEKRPSLLAKLFLR